MKQRRITIAFLLLYMMLFSFMQTESVKADTVRKVKLNYESDMKTKNVELYQYQGHGKKNEISNYKFVGKMEKDDEDWKMIIKREKQNQYALSINHKEYLEYFTVKNQDIGDIQTNIPEVFLSSSKFIAEDGKQKVKIGIRTISQTGDPVSSKFQVKALEDIKDDSGYIKYHAGSKVLNITENTMTEKYLYPGKYQIRQTECEEGYVKSKGSYNFEIRKQKDCQIQSVSAIIQNPITQLQFFHVAENGKLLNDGVFTLFDKDHNPLYTFRDVPYDHVQMNGLTVGKKYHVMQNKAISGYENIDCDFIVQDTAKIQHVYLYSKKAKKPNIKQVKEMVTMIFLLCLY